LGARATSTRLITAPIHPMGTSCQRECTRRTQQLGLALVSFFEVADRDSRPPGTALGELGHAVFGTSSALEMSYAGLAAASAYVESIGFDRAEREVYDHLVAYVGEVIRVRTRGKWRIDRQQGEPYPYVAAPKHAVIMPINVVWSELGGLNPPDLRTEAANEVRRARAKYF
jgi:hypothetical protein